MAEVALFSLAEQLLGELASPLFERAFERVRSIWHAKKDLDDLSRTIQLIQAVLLDAEKKQKGPGPESENVRGWIQMVRDVLYDADDLFDEVATNALLEQQQQQPEDTTRSKVRAKASHMFRAIKSNDHIAKKVKDIRTRLDEISKDMNQFNFIYSSCENQASVLLEREQTMPFVDEEVVIGRETEKNAILKFLFDDEQCVSVISIVGIGGMGKTTLAQLIYNNKDVQEKFKEKWWACISDIVGETKVLKRIAQSINKDFRDSSDAKEEVSRSVKMGRRYLLVLDDVWDTDLSIWFDIMNLLRSGTKGSKIIVTTRFESVTKEFDNDKSKIYTLNGLSDDMSWKLFKQRAFTKKQENDATRWTSLGWEIMKKCSNVPLAIKIIASLLREKNTIQEWMSFKENELFKIEVGGNSIMSTLKVSYDHLPSTLKNCFAYCSLFPQDHIFDKKDLISRWIGQGYVQPNNNQIVEEVGHSYFMQLCRKSFFQVAKVDGYGEVENCKMHDLMHDLAREVAGKESLTLTTGWNQFSKNARHLYIYFDSDGCFENIPQSLLAENRLRSCFLKPGFSQRPLVLDGLLTTLKLLRCLDLCQQRIETVPCSIGDLKHLRYLNLSNNQLITSLPDSLTNLVNLVTLDISDCSKLRELPNDFRKLINLRHFYNRCSSAYSMRKMPPGFGELTSLQHLDFFRVGKKGDCCSRLDEVARLKLQGKLLIRFEETTEDQDVDEQWKLSKTLQELCIVRYPGKRVPHWESGNLLPILVKIEMYSSSTVEHLPPLKRLPYLKVLILHNLKKLEYVEEDEEGQNEKGEGHSTTFFPCLEILDLVGLDSLKGWSKKVNDHNRSFPLLSELHIIQCRRLLSMPHCPCLQTLNGKPTSGNGVADMLTRTSNSQIKGHHLDD